MVSLLNKAQMSDEQPTEVPVEVAATEAPAAAVEEAPAQSSSPPPESAPTPISVRTCSLFIFITCHSTDWLDMMDGW
jgi:3-oxoacyl-ACP reductase-like protein